NFLLAHLEGLRGSWGGSKEHKEWRLARSGDKAASTARPCWKEGPQPQKPLVPAVSYHAEVMPHIFPLSAGLVFRKNGINIPTMEEGGNFGASPLDGGGDLFTRPTLRAPRAPVLLQLCKLRCPISAGRGSAHITRCAVVRWRRATTAAGQDSARNGPAEITDPIPVRYNSFFFAKQGTHDRPLTHDRPMTHGRSPARPGVTIIRAPLALQQAAHIYNHGKGWILQRGTVEETSRDKRLSAISAKDSNLGIMLIRRADTCRTDNRRLRLGWRIRGILSAQDQKIQA
ncbi:unnamed protein product, partial [Nesidiocoris tenuis]